MIDVIIELMKEDFPAPVAPATRRCGIFARLATTYWPRTFLPTPTVRGWSAFCATWERRTSPSMTVSRSVLGISMPMADLPGMGERMRTSAEATA